MSMRLAQPIARRWTRREYYKMAEMGWFRGQRVELINGEIVQMAPQKDRHAFAIRLVDCAIRSAFGEGFVFSAQLPMNLGLGSDPEPDMAVVKSSVRGLQKHPTSALLVVEVSDESLAYDRNRKGSLYAAAGIQDYWIVNLVHRQLEVRRRPIANARKEFGFSYGDLTIRTAKDTVTPLALPKAKIKVADLMP
jgi:Uma2 family endonuclease